MTDYNMTPHVSIEWDDNDDFAWVRVNNVDAIRFHFDEEKGTAEVVVYDIPDPNDLPMNRMAETTVRLHPLRKEP